MFTKRKGAVAASFAMSQTRPPAAPPRDDGATIIAAGMTVTGDLACRGEVLVRGCVCGDIIAVRVIVEAHGEVKGAIRANLVNVHGTVSGPVTAPEIAIMKTATASGILTHHTLAIEPGAMVEGRAPWRPKPDWENWEAELGRPVSKGAKKKHVFKK